MDVARRREKKINKQNKKFYIKKINNNIKISKAYGVILSTKKCTLYLKKMQFCVCFLKMFRPLKGWYVLF